MAGVPPRLPDQPIFYPVLNEGYAVQIARDWNVPASGSGFVTRFEVDAAFADRYPCQIVGGREREELWVPSEELAEFNRHIIGSIEVVAEFHGENDSSSKNLGHLNWRVFSFSIPKGVCLCP